MVKNLSPVFGFIGKLDGSNHAMRAIRNNQLLTVGRESTCDVVLPAKDVAASRQHGTIEIYNGRAIWRVARTKNGTSINGLLFDYPEMVHLYDGDTITLGNTQLTFLERRKSVSMETMTKPMI